MQKQCVICGKTFTRPKGYGNSFWERRKTCSVPCRTKWQKENKIGFQRGHAGYKNSGTFKTGHETWNKGQLGKKDWHNTSGLVMDGSVNRGKKFSDEIREKMSRGQTGILRPATSKEKHWNWKGGITPLRKKIMQTAKYREWRKTIYERDDYTCQKCGCRGGKLHADHIKRMSVIIHENKITKVQHAHLCSELWDISNGRTLCVACHIETDTWGGRSAEIDLSS